MSWLTKEGWVYFVGEPGAGPVKVGWTTCVEQRLRTIRIACPMDLEILAAFRGSIMDERRLHGFLDPLHIRGEWFRREGRLAKLLRHLRSEIRAETEVRWIEERGRWAGKQPQPKKRWVYVPSPEVLKAAGIE